MSSDDFSAERKSVHALANHLTVIQTAVKKVIRSMDEKALQLPEERDRLAKADDYLRKSVEVLRELRANIVARVQEQEES